MISYYQGLTKLPISKDLTPIVSFPKTVRGTTSTITLSVKNDTNYPVSLEGYSNDPELKITRYPTLLQAGERDDIEISFSPAKDRIVPLVAKWGFLVTMKVPGAE